MFGLQSTLPVLKCTVPSTDIFLLTETWVDPEGVAPELEGYTCISKSRPHKHVGAGRSSGGLAVYVKTHLSPFVGIWKASVDASLLWLKVDRRLGLKQDLFICLTYIWPYGSTHYDLPIAIDPFHTVADDISSIYDQRGLVLLAGDFNARTGAEKDWVDKEEYADLLHTLDAPLPMLPDLPDAIAERSSCDQQVNQFGQRLIALCQTANLLILNGRVDGDVDGKCTCHRPNGQSVVDYFVASPGLLEHDLHLCVQDIVPESDHCPVVLKIAPLPDVHMSHLPPEMDGDGASGRCSPDATSAQETGMTPTCLAQPQRIRYKPDRSEIFCETLSESLSFHFGNDDSSQSQTCYATALQECIMSSAVHAFGKQPAKSHRHVHRLWYDDECKRLRLQIVSLDPHDAEREHLQKEYRRMIRRKRRQHEHECTIELCQQAKTDPHKFWRRYKQAKPRHSNISPQIWQQAFEALVGTSGNKSPSAPFSFSPLIADTCDYDDDEFTLMLNEDITCKEVDIAMQKLKPRKAAGNDGIKPEYLLDAKDVLLQPLTTTFNQMLHHGVPDSWCTGVIHPVFESGDENDPCNYRGITVTSVLSKLFAQFAIVLESSLSA